MNDEEKAHLKGQLNHALEMVDKEDFDVCYFRVLRAKALLERYGVDYTPVQIKRIEKEVEK